MKLETGKWCRVFWLWMVVAPLSPCLSVPNEAVSKQGELTQGRADPRQSWPKAGLT